MSFTTRILIIIQSLTFLRFSVPGILYQKKQEQPVLQVGTTGAPKISSLQCLRCFDQDVDV